MLFAENLGFFTYTDPYNRNSENMNGINQTKSKGLFQMVISKCWCIMITLFLGFFWLVLVQVISIAGVVQH